MGYDSNEVILVFDMGLRLKELRQKKKLSQAGLASRLDLHKSTIAGYENNTKTPSADVIVKLALFHNVSCDYILGLDHKKYVSVEGLPDRKIQLIESLIEEFQDDIKSNSGKN